MQHIDFPARLRAMRKHAGLSQKKLADALKLTRSSINEWEAGRVRLPGNMLLPIAEACGLGWEDWMKENQNAS